MKKTIIALVAITMMVCLAVPVSAATVKLNGKVGYGNSITLGAPITLTSVINSLNLDLGFSVTEGEFALKLGANVYYDSLVGNFLNINSDDWFASIETPFLDVWYSTGVNEGYKFEPFNDAFGLGGSIYNGGNRLNTQSLNVNYANSDAALFDEGLIFDGFGYTYGLMDFLHVRPSSLLKIDAKISSTTITGYYAPKILIYESKERLDLRNPLFVAENGRDNNRPAYQYGIKELYGTPIDDDASTLVLLRINSNLFYTFNLGATITYANVADTLGTPNDYTEYINLGLDITSGIPLLGGNITLAAIATIEPDWGHIDFMKKLAPLSDGYGFYAGISDVPLDSNKIITIGVDFAAVMPNAFSPFVTNESMLYESDYKRFGLNFAGKLNIDNIAVDLEVSNDFVGPYSGNFDEDVINLNVDAKLGDDYKLGFALTSRFSLVDGFNTVKANTGILLDFEGKFVEGFVLKASFKNINYHEATEYDMFAARAIAIYDGNFAPAGVISSANYQLAGSLGYLSGAIVMLQPEVTYDLYTGFDVLFTNNFGLSGGIYLGYNPEMNPKYNKSVEKIEGFDDLVLASATVDTKAALVASLTAKYYFTPSIYAYLTGTFRNWWTFDIANVDYSTAGINFFFAQIGVTVNTKENIYVNVSLGNSGLADPRLSDASKNSKALPWTYLEIAPRSTIFSSSILNVNFEIAF